MQSPKQNPKPESTPDKDVVSAHGYHAPCPHCGYHECPNCGHPVYPEIRWWPDWTYRPYWPYPVVWASQSITSNASNLWPDGLSISIMN